MLFFKNLHNLSKLLQKTNTPASYATSVRGLRKLSQQNYDLQELNTALSHQESITDVRDLTHSEDDRNSRKRYLQKEYKQSDKLPGTELQDEHFVPTFNLAAYVDKSPTLQQLIHMGVDLNSIERRKGLAQFVLKLDFEQDIKPYLLFLSDQGVPAERFGEMITKNPLLFKVDMDDLQTRLNYLEAKKFTQTQMLRIITINPFWLMFSTERIDKRLGYFQQEFHLSGDDVRFLSSKQPRLITYNMDHVHKATFSIREEMGFERAELKCLLLGKPRLWMMRPDELVERFAYAHDEMQLSHDMLIQCPEVLTSRLYRLRQRHEFLKMMGRAQYNPAKDLYISPKAVVEGTDYYFAKNAAKSDMETYELFLKTR